MPKAAAPGPTRTAAARWYHDAAVQGVVPAMVNVAILYEPARGSAVRCRTPMPGTAPRQGAAMPAGEARARPVPAFRRCRQGTGRADGGRGSEVIAGRSAAAARAAAPPRVTAPRQGPGDAARRHGVSRPADRRPSSGGESRSKAPPADHHPGSRARGRACCERAGAIGEQRETGRAAAAHPRQQRAGQARQAVEHRADFRHQASAASVRSLRRAASIAPARRHPRHRGEPAGLPNGPRRARNTAGGRQCAARIGQHDPERRQAGAGSMRSPMPPTQTGRPARQAGTSAPSSAASAKLVVVDRMSPKPPAPATSRPRRLDPPPIPAAAGRLFSRCNAAPRPPRRQPASRRAARSTRLSSPSPASAAGFRAARPSAQRVGRRGGNPVADIGEGDQAVEQMIAVGAPPDDMQVEIDLRRRETVSGTPAPGRISR